MRTKTSEKNKKNDRKIPPTTYLKNVKKNLKNEATKTDRNKQRK